MWYNDGMGKAPDKSKHNWKVKLVTACILGIFIGILFFLNWIWDTYGQEYALTWVAVIIAAIAAIAALESLRATRRSLELTKESLQTTRESLELTRATTRPFLNVSVPKTILFQSELRLVICNTGALPADKVEILCTLCTMENEVVIKEYELPAWNKAPSIYFPGDEVGPIYRWSPRDYDFTDDSTRRKNLIRVTIDYRNRLTQEVHTTTRIFMAETTGISTYLLVPIPRYDSWDEKQKG